ncbi:PepSY domain-containing protein [Marinifilum breve]|uniref:PepSY domain-containing protein n=1 Tax=Marinifilum breve TaxID=2184082 RepID=UPI00140216DA|nr:PepSY domain-containing protein [Marinifilum breve]
MKSKIYKISRWIHKYFGLLVLLFMAYMSLSGILLNHPDLIQNASVSRMLVPKQYQPDNWNRSSLKGIEYLGDSLLVYGRQGIFLSTDNGKSLQAFMQGDYPKSALGKRSNHLYYSRENKLLLCASNQGCLQYNFKQSKWINLPLPNGDHSIIKILNTGKHLLLVSKSDVYQTSLHNDKLNFEKLSLKKKKYSSYISLIQVFFQLHDGSIWGLPGKILWDIVGLILFFLSISAFYIWYYPKKWKRRYKREGRRASYKEKNVRSFFFKYHKKLGWYFAIFLVLITFTGMFMNPILMMTLVNGKVNSKYYPSLKNENPWYHKIRNALYDNQQNQLVLECSDGIWVGNYNENIEFEKIKLPVRIFGMGTTVFREEKPGVWLVGSFGGLNRVDRNENQSEKILQTKKSDNSGRPASTFVTAYEKLPDGNHYIMGHYKGICNVKGEKLIDVFPMPDKIRKNSKLPLWNYMFELHNARMFRGLIGGFYMLIIPLGGLLCLLMLLAGVLDYWLTKPKVRNRIN